MLFAPYSSYLGILLIILTLIGVTFNPTHRIGLLVSMGIIAIISLASTKLIIRNKKLNS